jgi:hypothetical protein
MHLEMTRVRGGEAVEALRVEGFRPSASELLRVVVVGQHQERRAVRDDRNLKPNDAWTLPAVRVPRVGRSGPPPEQPERHLLALEGLEDPSEDRAPGKDPDARKIPVAVAAVWVELPVCGQRKRVPIRPAAPVPALRRASRIANQAVERNIDVVAIQLHQAIRRATDLSAIADTGCLGTQRRR